MPTSLTPLEDSPARDVDIDDGPPAPKSKPKKASPNLYSQSGASLMDQGQAGLGAEGGSQPIIAMKALADITNGIKTLSTVLPGIIPVTSDLMGRLQMIVPQALSELGMGPGLVPMNGLPPQQPAPMPPPPMGAGPMGPPPPGGMPPGPPQF